MQAAGVGRFSTDGHRHYRRREDSLWRKILRPRSPLRLGLGFVLVTLAHQLGPMILHWIIERLALYLTTRDT